MEKLPDTIRKRDGSIVPFQPDKIRRAVLNAAAGTVGDHTAADSIADRITSAVLGRVSRLRKRDPLTIDTIQDIVEKTLIDQGVADIAKRFILYRKERQDLRDTKTVFGIPDDLKLPVNALLVLKERYLLKNDRAEVIETPGALFQRVAAAVSRAELNYGGTLARRKIRDDFYGMMHRLEFLPNSPTLMNAGTPVGQLSACFVLPVDDSLESLFEAVKNMAMIHRTGGGTGFDFSRIRPRGELVSTTKGKASGPVSFMSIFNQTTDVIIQGGRRRGANMGILRCDHPDIFEFVEAKLLSGSLANFNISVAVTDRFMRAVRTNRRFDLISPRTGRRIRTIKARALFDLICFAAWRTGDPGLLFLDEINRRNVTPLLGRIEATNPCSEVMLLPYESCNLASINLAAMVQHGTIDWKRLRTTVHLGIRFLDNVIDINRYPLRAIRQITCANRKVGLGVMGFADMLIKLGIAYSERRAELLAARIMKFIRTESRAASRLLAGERGSFPHIDQSIYAAKNIPMRNATVNAIAPTGTISIIAGCSSGIEPLFSISYMRTVMGGTKLFELHPDFEQELKNRGMYSHKRLAQVRRAGSIRSLRCIPPDVRRLFATSLDVLPEQHLRIQAAFQKYTDNSVSKTVNLPHDATVEDVRSIYVNAYTLKCKGITVYRYGSKPEQVLSFGHAHEENSAAADSRPASSNCASGQCDV